MLSIYKYFIIITLYKHIFICFKLDFSYLVCYGNYIKMERRYLREIICVTERGERRQYKLTPF